jgi:hypothetical protein
MTGDDMKAEVLHGKKACDSPCGSYEELSPREFSHHKELVVVLMKSPHALSEFEGFRAVIPVGGAQSLPAQLAGLEPGQALGIVCPDGDCSGRLAIRLSNLGYPVYHLGGGLREWYHSFREVE